MTKHLLIAFEGLDFSGKSTISKKLASEFKNSKTTALNFYHEPGGTDLSEKISAILAEFGRSMQKRTKTLLFEAARNELVHDIITPKLETSSVILDRFIASTIAYQHFGDDQSIYRLTDLNKYVLDGLTIDATFYFSITPETMKARRATRQNKIDELDNYDVDYYKKIGENYLEAIRNTPNKKIIVIDANKNIDDVYNQVKSELKKLEVI